MSTLTALYREPVPAGWLEGLDVDAVLAGQGIGPSGRSARPAAIEAAAARALREGLPLLAPAVATRLLPVEHADLREVTLKDGAAIRGLAAARKLSGSLQLLGTICTVGPATDERAAEIMQDDIVLALAFDGLGTAAVNRLAALICRDLRLDAARSGQRTTPPLSPGHGEWDLEEGQRLVFDRVQPARIGVRLSERGQMQPCKSLSFVIGIGPTVNDRAAGHCAGCSARPGCHWSK